MIVFLLISILAGFGLAIALVEKGDKYPIRFFKDNLYFLIYSFLGEKAAEVLNCTVCTSFWATLLIDIYLYFRFDAHFIWPISGFITLGFTWVIINLINVLDREEGI